MSMCPFIAFWIEISVHSVDSDAAFCIVRAGNALFA